MNEEIKQEQRGNSLAQTFTQQRGKTTQAIETTTDKFKLAKTIAISIIVFRFLFWFYDIYMYTFLIQFMIEKLEKKN